MGTANIDALIAEIASIKESLRIKNQSLANINPNYQMNAAYIAKLKQEIASLNSDLSQAEANLKSASTPAKVPPTRANTETSVQSTPYDDEGNLNFGWQINQETGEPYYTGEPPQPQKTISPASDNGSDPYVSNGQTTITPIAQPAVDDGSDPYVSNGQTTIAPADTSSNPSSNTQGLAPLQNTRSQATQQDVSNFYQTGDWRVRLSLAPSANYLYKNQGNEGILLPLVATNGVLFPYTPSISVNYAAHYDSSDLTHSNYKIHQYKNSSVDQINITCDFTAQDTFEARYLLAVIHFLRSVTKMFYGQDQNPNNGTPPPLCYLTGLGAFQFDKHPLAITAFNYTLPTDVDYIRATNTTTTGGVNKSFTDNVITGAVDLAKQRLIGLLPGGLTKNPNFQNALAGSIEPTYVPTKMQIQISAIPIVTRNDISREFSLKKYATGELLRGSKRSSGGGIW